MFAAIAKTYRGERPLWQTYWIWGALPSAVLTVSTQVLTPLLIGYSFRYPSFPKIAYYSILCIWGAFVVFFVGAVWSSSANYKGSRVWKVLARVVCVLAVVNLLGALIPGARDTSQEGVSVEKQLAQTAAALNQGLPRKQNDYTQLTGVSADQTTLTYHHAIINMNKDELAEDSVQRMHDSTVKGMCAESDVVATLRQGVTYVYEYSLNGKPLFSFQITKQDCPR